MSGTFYPRLREQLEAEWHWPFDASHDDAAIEGPLDLLLDLARSGHPDALDELRREVGPLDEGDLFAVW